MSRPDLLDELRAARPAAPDEVRELVRRLVVEALPEPERPRFLWRRNLLVILVPVAVAAIAAAIFIPGGPAPTTNVQRAALAPRHVPGVAASRTAAQHAAAGAAASTNFAAATPTPSSTRVQHVTTWLQLRVANASFVSSGAQQAVQITHALGGYPSSLNVNAAGRTGYADLTLRIPKQHLQAAMSRLSALGTVIGENVTIHDLQNQVDATARKIARLEARLKAWQEQFQTEETQKHIAELTDQIGTLSRGRAATIHSASYATVTLQLTTRTAPPPVHKAGHGPLHDLGVAFRWLGIGALYAVALSAPFILLGLLVWLIVRAVRRHRENQLLSSS